MRKTSETKLQQLMKTTLLATSVILGISFILYLTGNRFFVIEQRTLDWNMITIGIISYLLVWFHTAASLFFAIGQKYKKILIGMAIYIVIDLAYCTIIGTPNQLVQGILMISYGLLFCIVCKTNILRNITRLLLFHTAIILYQFITFHVKLSAVNIFGGNEITMFYQYLIWNIDYILLLICVCLYGIKGGRLYDYIRRSIGNIRCDSTECMDNLQRQRTLESLEQANQESVREFMDSLTKQDRFKARLVLLLMWIGQMYLLVLACTLGSVLTELLVILPSFWVFRAVFGKAWHASSFGKCTVFSVLVFYIGGRATIPLEYSMIIPVLTGLSIAFALYKVQEYIDNQAEISAYENIDEILTDKGDEIIDMSLLSKVKSKHIQIKHKLLSIPTKNQVKELLDDAMLSDEEQEMIKLYYIDKKSLGYIGDTMGYSPSGINIVHKKALLKLEPLLDNILHKQKEFGVYRLEENHG